MSDERYNGWANHATWCVHRHITNTEATQELTKETASICKREAPHDPHLQEGIWGVKDAAQSHLADELERWITGMLINQGTMAEISPPDDDFVGLLRLDLLTGYLRKVNWGEIAAAFLEEPATSTATKG